MTIRAFLRHIVYVDWVCSSLCAYIGIRVWEISPREFNAKLCSAPVPAVTRSWLMQKKLHAQHGNDVEEAEFTRDGSGAVAALAIDKAGPRPCHFRPGPTSGPATRPVSQTRKPSWRWQTRETIAKSLHGLRKSDGVVSCIASLPIDSVPMVSYYVLTLPIKCVALEILAF